MRAFTIERRREAGVTLIALRGPSGLVELIPELGGMVHRIALVPGRPGGRRASLRKPEAAPVELLCSDRAGELRANPLYRGRLLFPFSDRLPQGRYSFAGKTHQLAINSPEDGSALHGLLYRLPLPVVREEASATRALLRLEVEPERYRCAGYPFPLSLTVTYLLDEEDFSLCFSIRNWGSLPAPFGLGWHPYYSLGVAADELRLRVASGEYLPADERALPLGRRAPVAGTPLDFRSGEPIGSRSLDATLAAPESGAYSLEGGGLRLELFQSPALFPWLQLYVPPDRRSLALEPIASPPNAFNTPSLGPRILAPGVELGGEVRVALVPAGIANERQPAQDRSNQEGV